MLHLNTPSRHPGVLGPSVGSLGCLGEARSSCAMAASSLAAGGLAAPRLVAARRTRACTNVPCCPAGTVRGSHRRAPTTPHSLGSSLAQRVVHRGAQLPVRPRARALKQPQSRSGLVRCPSRSRLCGLAVPKRLTRACVRAACEGFLPRRRRAGGVCDCHSRVARLRAERAG